MGTMNMTKTLQPTRRGGRAARTGANAEAYLREARRQSVWPGQTSAATAGAGRAAAPMQERRRVGLAQTLLRLEREHIALLLAMCELEAQQSRQSASGMTARTVSAQGGATMQASESLRAALAPMLREDLRRAQYALARAAQGMYGVCEQCGRPIALRRLQLQASATTCQSCAAHQR